MTTYTEKLLEKRLRAWDYQRKQIIKKIDKAITVAEGQQAIINN